LRRDRLLACFPLRGRLEAGCQTTSDRTEYGPRTARPDSDSCSAFALARTNWRRATLEQRRWHSGRLRRLQRLVHTTRNAQQTVMACSFPPRAHCSVDNAKRLVEGDGRSSSLMTTANRLPFVVTPPLPSPRWSVPLFRFALPRRPPFPRARARSMRTGPRDSPCSKPAPETAPGCAQFASRAAP